MQHSHRQAFITNRRLHTSSIIQKHFTEIIELDKISGQWNGRHEYFASESQRNKNVFEQILFGIQVFLKRN